MAPELTRAASMSVVRRALATDPARTSSEIGEFIQRTVTRVLGRRGAIIGLSGGVDSSVCAALCVRALGADRVLGLFTPEAESAEESLELGRLVAGRLGIRTILEDITRALEAVGCYRRRDEAIRSVIPQYGGAAVTPGGRWRAKLVRPGLLDGMRYRLFSVVAEAPDGSIHRARLTPDAYRQVVAATNFKQRTRKMIEYHHADRLDYAVVGTPNRLEYDQGFFVKNGDGAADLKPIAHLYKTQVYQLAEYLHIPEQVCSRPPTTDTYSLPQDQDEFYFSLPFSVLDLCLCAFEAGIPASELAPEVGLQEQQVQWVYADIQAKRRTTRHLHMPPLLASSAQFRAVPDVRAQEGESSA